MKQPLDATNLETAALDARLAEIDAERNYVMWATIEDKEYRAAGETVHMLSERLEVPFGWLVRSTIISPRGVAVSQVFIAAAIPYPGAAAAPWQMPQAVG